MCISFPESLEAKSGRVRKYLILGHKFHTIRNVNCNCNCNHLYITTYAQTFYKIINFLYTRTHGDKYPSSGRRQDKGICDINPLNPELIPICYLLALLGAHHFLHVSRIKVKLLTFRLLMSYIYIYIYIYI